MAIFEIPTNKDLTDYQFSSVIDGVVYFFNIVYNSRISRYVLNILDSTKNLIISGIPILTNVPLTTNFKYLDIPKGDFLPFSADNENAILNDFGDKVRLYYDNNE